MVMTGLLMEVHDTNFIYAKVSNVFHGYLDKLN